MIYFQDRIHAGRLLAEEIMNSRNFSVDTPSVIMALNPGGVLVAAPLAKALNCSIVMLLIEPIELPGVNKETIGMINQRGDFVYNDRIPSGMLEELQMEFHGVIEEQKIEKMHKIHELLGEGGTVTPEAVTNRNVYVVTDGLNTGSSFSAAAAYLKSIKIKKFIGLAPVSTVTAVDKLHILCDEIFILDVIPETFDTDHYYEDNITLPAKEISSLLSSEVKVDD